MPEGKERKNEKKAMSEEMSIVFLEVIKDTSSQIQKPKRQDKQTKKKIQV